MAVLKPTPLQARVQQLLRNSDPRGSLATEAVGEATFGFAGMVGDSHASLTRAACVRTRQQYEEGTEIRNVRQLTIIGVDEIADIQAAMNLPGDLRAEWLGVNLVLEGIRQITLLPPGSRLIFEQGPSFVIDMENEPCKGPADLIEQHHPGFGKHFVKAAMHRRGVTAWVEREGRLALGHVCLLHTPPRRAYPHLSSER